MTQSIPMNVPLIGRQAANQAHREAEILTKRLEVAAGVLGHVMAMEFQNAMNKFRDQADLYQNGAEPPPVAINIEQAVNVSIAAADALFVRLGILRPAPGPNGA